MHSSPPGAGLALITNGLTHARPTAAGGSRKRSVAAPPSGPVGDEDGRCSNFLAQVPSLPAPCHNRSMTATGGCAGRERAKARGQNLLDRPSSSPQYHLILF